ncbi:MAG: beta-propeller fold lactonase family protein [Acidobacteria bacterium]|nr:beta-propeller fold lactonase family protein [Acidobacteriota bacterium]
MGVVLVAFFWILGAVANFQGSGETAAQDSSEVYKRVYNGWKWWHVYCYRCHGADALGSTLAPNLSDPSRKITSQEFLYTTRNGAPQKGMPAWNQLLDDNQITDLYTYVRARTERVLPPGRPDEVGANGGPWIPPEGWPTALSLAAVPISPEKALKTTAVPASPAKPLEAMSAPRVYVTNEASGDVTVIDSATDRVLTTIPVGKRPRGIQVSPDGKSVYVALSGSPFAGPDVRKETLVPANKKADGIGVIDPIKNKLIGILSGGSDPEQFVVSRDGTRLYVANEDASSASVVDVASGKVVRAIPVGKEPEGVALSPDGKIVYVTAENSQSVSVIETETNKVRATFKVGPGPRAAAFAPDGSRAYVTSEMGATVSVVDTAQHRVTHTVKLEGNNVRPMGVAVAPDGKRVYVTTGHSGKVLVIDTSTHRVVASFEVGKRPWGIAITPDGKRIYTANGLSDDVSVVDAVTHRVIARIKVGERPWGVAIAP